MHKLVSTLLLLTFFGVFAPVYSNGLAPSNTSGNPEDFSCNLPPVSNLHVTNVTPNSVTVQWTADPNAIGYEATAYDSITNAVLSGPVSAGAASAYLGGLPSSRSVRIEVASRCANGILSNQVAIVFAKTSDIVIEIVYKGLTCNSQTGQWTTYSLTGTDIITPIELSSTVYVCQMIKQINGETISSEFWLNSSNTNGKIQNIQSGAGTVTGWGGSGNYIRARFMANSTPLCTLAVVSNNTNSGSLRLTNVVNDNSYTFRIRPCGSGKPGGLNQSAENRENATEEYAESLFVSPNPFSDHLTIRFPEDNEDDGPATAGIYYMNGMLARSEALTAARGKTLTMNTSDLPAGMYLLRTETLTGVTTKLLMKSE